MNDDTRYPCSDPSILPEIDAMLGRGPTKPYETGALRCGRCGAQFVTTSTSPVIQHSGCT